MHKGVHSKRIQGVKSRHVWVSLPFTPLIYMWGPFSSAWHRHLITQRCTQVCKEVLCNGIQGLNKQASTVVSAFYPSYIYVRALSSTQGRHHITQCCTSGMKKGTPYEDMRCKGRHVWLSLPFTPYRR